MIIDKEIKITCDGKDYLLEAGDNIIVNEGIISKAILAVINKIIPIDIVKKMDPQIKSWLADVVNDPEKAKQLAKIYKEKPDLFDLFT